MYVIGGIAIPFFGTAFGAAMVFLMRNQMCRQLEKLLVGVASGVMVAASVWSLLIPATEMAEKESAPGWRIVSVGFLLGVFFLILMDGLLKRLQPEENLLTGAGRYTGRKRIMMMVFVITLHNLPEGMAVGVSFAGAMLNDSGMTMAGAFALAVGIAIQNIPEGAIISMPLRSIGMRKGEAFLFGVLSGLVEPVGAAVTLALTGLVAPLLPYLLSFAAGAMIYVVVEELLPSVQQQEDIVGEDVMTSIRQDKKKTAVLGFTAGFVIMMALDVALG